MRQVGRCWAASLVALSRGKGDGLLAMSRRSWAARLITWPCRKGDGKLALSRCHKGKVMVCSPCHVAMWERRWAARLVALL